MTKKRVSKNTKIVFTVGPKIYNRDAIKKLIKAGGDIARLNGSHNNLNWHKKAIEMIRSVSGDIPILFDIPGRKIRTTQLKENLQFEVEDEIILTTDLHYKGIDKAPINYANLHEDVSPGDIIFADDGSLKFSVVEVRGRDIVLNAHNRGVLGSNKGINVPQIKIQTPLVTENDEAFLEFCIQNEVDYVGISFVENADHIRKIKSFLINSDIHIVAKIENQFGVKNLKPILEETDGIMIDRGDLGAETTYSAVGVLQKKILTSANSLGVPVIVATEMLHSMIENPQPTKSEVTDITNAVYDGASAIMLSGETAIGSHPVTAVETMSEIIVVAEKSLESGEKIASQSSSLQFAIGKAIYEISKMSVKKPVTKIVCITYTGFAPTMISRFFIKMPILAITDTLVKARKLNLYWGVRGINVPIKFEPKSTNHILESLEWLYQSKLIKDSDKLLVTAVRFPFKGSTMNMLEVHDVQDLASLFGWVK